MVAGRCLSSDQESGMKRRLARVLLLITAASSLAAQPAAPPDQSFDSAGVRIRFVEQGSGPALVLMHGYTGTLDRHFIANGVFANLAEDYRVIAFDLRGHGKSGKPYDPAAYGEAMAGDVVRLLDHLAIERAHVLGYSLGAMIAGRLAVSYPTRLRSIAYVASLPLREGDSYVDKFAEDAVKELESDLPFKSLVATVQPSGSTLPSEAAMREAMAPLVAANDVKALAALCRSYPMLKVRDTQLAAVAVPSMVFVGSEDISAAGIPALNKTHPQIRTLTVQGAQHGGPAGVMRRPEFINALRQFLSAARER
jgi:pimeloyl-ACP methyl ester carboxylesterase